VQFVVIQRFLGLRRDAGPVVDQAERILQDQVVTRSGFISVKRAAVMPPVEWPSTATLPTPRWSSKAAVLAASSWKL
jgi:hypothetical protein